MSWTVYILQSQKDKSCYTGITLNLKNRINFHNLGYSRYTSAKKPYELIWYCVFNSKKVAIDFEKYLKSGSGIAFRNKRLIK
ncbi:GIY-YIG nuclease family protein [Candidatus Falkowbacteria bacterium]|nr:GIY-YIG nuclease family protein [Candidatus Falkowbacteria bacterium]